MGEPINRAVGDPISRSDILLSFTCVIAIHQ
jgi:hypothetical protein